MRSPSSCARRAACLAGAPGGAQPTSRGPDLSSAQGPPGGGNAGSAGPCRRPLPVSELGEPLVRHLVDAVLRGWLDAADPAVAVIYLPAG